ncbi:hypothetical protein Y032_0120g920 [Ancylostoma ceylanicum]|uniref:Uncharacterized protein n=1 Tax=Ancylostoma ceylanicum TaxID=53326 RepID=A0A016T9V7_9BILA|nr:hypothetical protein Y032_0120g920 [Ancylostoma ceylanicum]
MSNNYNGSFIKHGNGILHSDIVAVKEMNENDDNKVLHVLMSYHITCIGAIVGAEALPPFNLGRGPADHLHKRRGGDRGEAPVKKASNKTNYFRVTKKKKTIKRRTHVKEEGRNRNRCQKLEFKHSNKYM